MKVTSTQSQFIQVNVDLLIEESSGWTGVILITALGTVSPYRTYDGVVHSFVWAIEACRADVTGALVVVLGPCGNWTFFLGSGSLQ